MPAWRMPGGGIALRQQSPMRLTRERDGSITVEDPDEKAPLKLSCGRCIGCREANARAWALRCHLELQEHDEAAFTTLTYDPKSLPPTLEKRHLQLFLKKLRTNAARSASAGAIRFFAAGEYGETTHRPHYHAILFGLGERHKDLIEETWGLGHARTYAATPASIAYVAGYSAKKYGWEKGVEHERIDLTTGEVYRWQPPFIQMSRRPGIGGAARRWVKSWRLFAVDNNGHRMKVPRFLHEAWKQQATEEEIEKLHQEKMELLEGRDTSRMRLIAGEQIAIRKQALKADKRKLG